MKYKVIKIIYLIKKKDNWLKFFKKYFNIVWYFIIFYSLPFLCTHLMLVNDFSINWLISWTFAVLLLAVLLDWLPFFILSLTGILSGTFSYYMQLSPHKTNMDVILSFIINVLWISLIYLAFVYKYPSKNREENQILNFSLYLNKFLEEKVKERTEELEKALKVKNEFLNNISHEIRTPIHGIAALSEALIEDWAKFSEDKKFELARKIAANANRLFSCIRTILDLSRINNGKLDMKFMDTNLVKLIEEIKSECEDLYISGKNIKIKFNSNGIKEAWILGDHERIMQVLRNLVTNAIKFTKEGIITLELFYNSKDQKFIFSISDNGIGIPKEEINDIFKPFYQSSLTKTGAGGTGLGLTISKDIIIAHGGNIYAENIAPRGAKFTFHLPSIVAPFSQKLPVNTIETLNLPKLKNIVVIDDELSVLMSIKMMLNKMGYSNIVTFDVPEEALIYLNHNRPDLILVDLMMHGINGVEILNHCQKDHHLKGVPKILQTGSYDGDLLSQVKNIDNLRVIHKPFNRNDLKEAFKELFDNVTVEETVS